MRWFARGRQRPRESVLRRAFVSEAAVEALDAGVLHRLAGWDEPRLDAAMAIGRNAGTLASDGSAAFTGDAFPVDIPSVFRGGRSAAAFTPELAGRRLHDRHPPSAPVMHLRSRMLRSAGSGH
jgi:hypothetical protein